MTRASLERPSIAKKDKHNTIYINIIYKYNTIYINIKYKYKINIIIIMQRRINIIHVKSENVLISVNASILALQFAFFHN